MISDQFRKDYRQLVAQGVEFTPEDIVRLNALMVRVTRSSTAARDVHLPRLAFLPRDSWWRAPLVLREPTIAHDLWVEMAERWIDTSREEATLFLYAYALSRHPAKLPDANRPRKVIRAVFTFAAKRLAAFTREQLKSAVEYVLLGNDWTVGEREVEKAGGGGESPTIGLLTSGRMLRLAITTDDAMRMTSSELTEAINRAWNDDGKYDAKKAHNRAFGEYVRAREEIRARVKAPKATGNETAHQSSTQGQAPQGQA